MWVFYKNGLNRPHVRGFITGTARVSGLQHQREREFKEGKGPREGEKSLSKYQRPKVQLQIPGERQKIWGPSTTKQNRNCNGHWHH